MYLLLFVLGGLLGLTIGAWDRLLLRRRLRPLLNNLSDSADVAKSLSVTSLIRRELLHLNERCNLYQEEVNLWKQLLEQAPIAFLYIDEENHLLWCNLSAQTLLQIDRWRPDQLRLLLELVRSYELDQIIQLTRCSQQTQSQEWLFFPVTTSFSETQAKLSAESLLLKAYSYPLPRQQVAIFIENRQPLTEFHRQQDRLFSDLTHELRTPLTAISLVAETLHQRLQLPEKRWVEQLLSEADRLRNLVNDWLMLVQLRQNPNQCLDYQTINLSEILLSSWQRLSPLAQENHVTMDYQGAEELVIKADPDHLIQVFINLLDNCIKHSPSEGTIYLSAQRLEPEASVAVDIIDQGNGFDPQDLPFVFERLFRGDVSRSRLKAKQGCRGSGLGLAIAKEIVEAHGGRISAQNDPKTGGAWLSVYLPIHPPLTPPSPDMTSAK